MAKLCECCGKKNDFLHGDEFDLGNNKILCHKCAAPIRDDMSDIYYVETDEDFKQLEEKILATCREHFDDDTTQAIASKLKTIHEKKFSHEENEHSDEFYLSKLYSNIGNKIKTCAKIFALLSAAICISLGIICIFESRISIGLLILILGPILSWVSSFILYGFGQLIENSDKLVELTQKQEKENEK